MGRLRGARSRATSTGTRKRRFRVWRALALSGGRCRYLKADLRLNLTGLPRVAGEIETSRSSASRCAGPLFATRTSSTSPSARAQVHGQHAPGGDQDRDPGATDEYRTRDPARLEGRDAVLYATLEQALRAFSARRRPREFDSDDDHDQRHEMPQIRIEFINIRDYRAPRTARRRSFTSAKFDGEWWERRCAPVIVNRDGLAVLLRRSDPTRTSLCTGNEGFTAGYIYKSAVITLGGTFPITDEATSPQPFLAVRIPTSPPIATRVSWTGLLLLLVSYNR